MKINKQDTNGVKALLAIGELGYDNYPSGGDVGRVYVGNGVSNIALAKKSEIDTKVVANANITAGTATKVTYDTKGLITAGTALSAGDIPVLDAGKITTGTLPVVIGGTGVTTSTGTGSVVLSTSPTLVTPNIGVATGTSFNSITGLASVAPLVADTASVGTGTTVARQDHVHPAQTSVTGNAATATTLQTARTIGMTGDVTWTSASFNGSANVTGTSTLATITDSGTGSFKKITTDTKGLVTAGTALSAGDIPVLDAGKITTGTLPVVIGGTGTTTSTGTGSVVLSSSPVLVTPTIGVATGTSFNSITGLASVAPLAAGTAAVGVSTLTARQDHVHPIQTTVSGNAGTATALATGRTIGMTGDVTWTSASFNGAGNVTGVATLATITDSGTGTFKKITTNTKGLVTGTQAVSQSDITGLLGTGSITNAMIANTAVANLSGTNTGDQTITLTGDITGSGTGSFAATLSNSGVTAGTYSKVTVDAKGRITGGSTPTMEDIPDATFKRSVRAATTANITLSATQTIDGIVLAVGDRVLVKDQTTSSQNGIYVVAAGAWTRALDADTASKIASALVAVDSGTVNGGKLFDNDFKTTDTLGTTAMLWAFNLDSGSLSSTTPLVAGTAAIGTGTTVARADHVHPAQTTITGNAGTATTLQTARTISGVSFNGSANINIEDRLGTAIASAATITVGTSGLGDYMHITGVTTITSLGTASVAGIRRTLIFDGALTLTHNATSLICPGATSIVTVAGTVIEVVAETTANWRVVSVTHPSIGMAELGYLDGVTSAIQTQMNLKAPLASPSLTGAPTAPTAVAGTNTEQLATTAFVQETVGNTAVALTGNQTIAGVKTFTSSPIVPTPTTDFQSVPLRSTNITVNVGAGQTYTTINQALEYLSGFYPMYKKSGVTATINLKAGFVMAEQVLVSGIDLGWITIVGEDAETIITHTALTTAFTGAYPAFGVDKGGTSPIIGQLFRFNVEKVGGNKHGLMTSGAGSNATVVGDKGFIGAGTFGIVANSGSTISADGANCSNAGVHGITASRGSKITVEGANCSNAGNTGIYVVSGSTINARSANCSNAGTNGIYANEGSTISASLALIQNQTTGTARVRAENGSHIEATGINTTGGTVAVFSQAVNTLTGNGIIYQ